MTTKESNEPKKLERYRVPFDTPVQNESFTINQQMKIACGKFADEQQQQDRKLKLV